MKPGPNTERKYETQMRKGSEEMIRRLWDHHPRILRILTEKNGTGRVPVGGFKAAHEPKDLLDE